MGSFFFVYGHLLTKFCAGGILYLRTVEQTKKDGNPQLYSSMKSGRTK